MAKHLTDLELLDIVRRAVEENEIDDADQYRKFVEGLASLVTDHFGGRVGIVSLPDEIEMSDEAILPADKRIMVAIRGDENIPEGANVYERYDTEGSLFDDLPPDERARVIEFSEHLTVRLTKTEAEEIRCAAEVAEEAADLNDLSAEDWASVSGLLDVKLRAVRAGKFEVEEKDERVWIKTLTSVLDKIGENGERAATCGVLVEEEEAAVVGSVK